MSILEQLEHGREPEGYVDDRVNFHVREIENGWLLEVRTNWGNESYTDDTVRESADRLWRLAERWEKVQAARRSTRLATAAV